MLPFSFLLHLVTGQLLAAEAVVILQGPSNMAVVVGSPMTMTCDAPSSVGSVDWYFTGFGRPDRQPISRGGTVSNVNFNEFAVDGGSVPGQRLTTRSAQLKHAGLYACSVTDKISASFVVETAQLTVLASNPVCEAAKTVVEENDTIEMSCRVNYSGAWEPVIEWRQHVTPEDVTGSVVTDGRSDMVAKGNAVTGRVVIEANVNRPNSRYSSRTFFRTSTHQLNATATNIPDYDYTWTSPIVQVTYGPNAAVVKPRKSTFSPGNQLNCSASANPPAVFRWNNLETGEVFDGPDFIVRDAMARSESHRFVCIARNNVTGSEVSSEVINMTVEIAGQDCGASLRDAGSSSSSDQNLVVVIIVAVTAMIIIASLTIYIIRLRRKLSGKDRYRDDRRADDQVPVVVNHVGESNYSVYSEIPGETTCARAMAAMNRESGDSGRAGSCAANCGGGGQFLPMTPTKTDLSIRRAAAPLPTLSGLPYDVPSSCLTNSPVNTTAPAVQNNEYLIPDRLLAATGKPSANTYSLARAADEGTTVEQGAADYVALTERKKPRPTTYTPLNDVVCSDEKQQIDNNDYLEPIQQPEE